MGILPHKCLTMKNLIFIEPTYKPLTRMESRIAREVALQKTDQEIGNLFRISTTTVSKHISNAMRKFGLHSRVGLGFLALRQGLVTLQEILPMVA